MSSCTRAQAPSDGSLRLTPLASPEARWKALKICQKGGHLPRWTKVQYSLAVDGDYDSVMATVLEILAARLGGLCLECVLTKTGLRADQALRQIDAMPMRVTDGRCGGCAAAGPVFAHAPGGSSG